MSRFSAAGRSGSSRTFTLARAPLATPRVRGGRKAPPRARCMTGSAETAVAQTLKVAEGEEHKVVFHDDEQPHGDASVSGTEVVVEGGDSPGKSINTLNVVFITSEVTPWSKSGGLADVCNSLPTALAARGHRVMVVSPRYKAYEGAADTGVRKQIGPYAEVGYFHQRVKGVDFVFVDHASYPREGGMYADAYGPYGDNIFRFSLLSLAGLEAPLVVPLPGATKDSAPSPYGEDCTFVANDWHTALVPVYLAAKYRAHGTYAKGRSVLAIHNLCHQGVFPPGKFEELMLPGWWYQAVEYQYPPHLRQGSYEEEGRSVNFMKAGITTADRIVTVSPGYAEEIQTYLGGWGMEGTLAQRQPVLNGITNGIDNDEWNPSTDKHLKHHYDATTFQEGKRLNKQALQEELGLPVNSGIPLIAFIGRLDPQKGADILLEAAPRLMQQYDIQLVCLGSGSKSLEDRMRGLEHEYNGRARAWVGFNEPFSHRLTAAADILLMPSRFEPCGLNQLYAMRYGAVPVAHKTGGLRNTVIDFDPWAQVGTGWTYTNCDAEGLTWAVGTAINTLKHHQEDFRKLQLRGMTQDLSWDKAAQQYEQIFEWARMDPPFCQ
uniref:Starch synthase, chloroplastic/amyloplastic n=1 Tax=Chlamydomonas euryale TaxID=1486919 RepID=A0A7R9Z6Q7_9CHLO